MKMDNKSRELLNRAKGVANSTRVNLEENIALKIVETIKKENVDFKISENALKIALELIKLQSYLND